MCIAKGSASDAIRIVFIDIACVFVDISYERNDKANVCMDITCVFIDICCVFVDIQKVCGSMFCERSAIFHAIKVYGCAMGFVGYFVAVKEKAFP